MNYSVAKGWVAWYVSGMGFVYQSVQYSWIMESIQRYLSPGGIGFESSVVESPGIQGLVGLG